MLTLPRCVLTLPSGYVNPVSVLTLPRWLHAWRRGRRHARRRSTWGSLGASGTPPSGRLSRSEEHHSLPLLLLPSPTPPSPLESTPWHPHDCLTMSRYCVYTSERTCASREAHDSKLTPTGDSNFFNPQDASSAPVGLRRRRYTCSIYSIWHTAYYSRTKSSSSATTVVLAAVLAATPPPPVTSSSRGTNWASPRALSTSPSICKSGSSWRTWVRVRVGIG
jgi:hypothetical protein